MKIALAQMKVVPGLPKRNLETMLDMIEQAKNNGVDLIAFPEMCVGGYLLGDKWTSDEFCFDLMRKNEALRKASNGIAIAYGNIFVDKNSEHPNRDGRLRKYNSVYVFQNGEAVKRVKETKILPDGVQPKTLLPTYRIFDDQRYFFSLENIASDFNTPLEELSQPFLIEVNGKKVPVGFELCEDLWCEDYKRNNESLNPTKYLINNGAELIVNLSASPWTFGKNGARDRRVGFLKEECNDKFVPFLYVNCVGVQNNGKNIVTFDGGSTVYNNLGLPVKFASAPYKQELIVLESENLGNPQVRNEKPKIAQKYCAIVQGIKSLKDLVGTKEDPRFVIGLSGGIDSAVVAALLAKAVGSENVLGVNLPTQYNSEKTKNCAEHVANSLGIGYCVIPIERLVEENTELLNRFDLDGSNRKLSTLNLENVQAKIRGTSVISNIAAKYNAIFPNNGNKLEVALGYATLYGDVNGALAPIADLTKTEVVELARYLNCEVFGKEVIPESLIPDRLWNFRADQIQPSAELKDKQVDPMKFGYHCALLDAMTDYKKHSPENLIEWYLDGTLDKRLDNYFEGLIENPKGLTLDLMKRWKVDNPKNFVEDLEWFSQKMQNNVFKRVQAPPIIITSKTAFGYDLRESMLPYEKTEREEELRQEVLKMPCYKPRQEKLDGF